MFESGKLQIKDAFDQLLQHQGGPYLDKVVVDLLVAFLPLHVVVDDVQPKRKRKKQLLAIKLPLSSFDFRLVKLN